MTDRVNAITVVLKDNTRVDDVECITNAIRMISGVVSVEINVSDLCEEYIAKERLRLEFKKRIYAAIQDI